VKSHISPDFRKLFAALPQDVRDQARAAYRLFRANPRHPGLNFKRVHASDRLFQSEWVGHIAPSAYSAVRTKLFGSGLGRMPNTKRFLRAAERVRAKFSLLRTPGRALALAAERGSVGQMALTQFLMAVLVLAHLDSARASDACSQLMPADLRRFIAAHYPDRLLPSAKQTEPEDLTYSVEHGGTGCLRLAVADVDGDGRNDYAALLVSRTKPTDTDFVVFRQTTNGWRAYRLAHAQDVATSRYYVEACPPGTYRMSEAIAEITEPGERSRIVSRRPGFFFSAFESADVAYFYQHGRWVHVHVTD
jgi:hypothetical protein